MIARFLCWVGCHAVTVTHPGEVDRSTNLRNEARGYCTRCNKKFRWDA